MLYWLMVFAQRIAGVTPRRVRWFIGGAITELVYWVWREKRIATEKNMSVVLDLPKTHPKVRQYARLSWRNYGHYVADLFDITNHPPTYYFDHTINISNDDTSPDRRVLAAHALGKGVFIATAHFGNWDIAGTLLAKLHPLYAIAEQLPDKKLNELVQQQRKDMGILLIFTNGALREMLRLLRAGEIIATPIDRPVAPTEGIPISFFNHTAYVPRGLGAIAAKTGSAIVSGYISYITPDTYKAEVFDPIFIEKSGSDQQDAIDATQAMYTNLEQVIQENPTQWYMFRQFWPESEIIKHEAEVSRQRK